MENLKKTIIEGMENAEYTHQDLKRIQKIRKSILEQQEKEKSDYVKEMNKDNEEIPEILGGDSDPFLYRTEEERKLRAKMSRKAIENPLDETQELIDMLKRSKKTKKIIFF